MRKINFTDKNGTFTITNPENYIILKIATSQTAKRTGKIVK